MCVSVHVAATAEPTPVSELEPPYSQCPGAYATKHPLKEPRARRENMLDFPHHVACRPDPFYVVI